MGRNQKTFVEHVVSGIAFVPGADSMGNVQLKNSLTGHCKRKQIEDWFSRLGISDKWDQQIGKMSFGQQQRVAFVRALCQPFDFIF